MEQSSHPRIWLGVAAMATGLTIGYGLLLWQHEGISLARGNVCLVHERCTGEECDRHECAGPDCGCPGGCDGQAS